MKGRGGGSGRMSVLHWGDQVKWREKIHRRYPDVWDMGIVKKRLPFILEYLKDGESVLEIGAHDRQLGDRIKKHLPHVLYKSLDIDPSYRHDYTSMDEVKEEFNMVLLFELIEHLDRESGKEMVTRIFEVLRPGGRVILTTPNVYTPGQYWKDISHRTAYHYEELGGLFLSLQFESVDLFRYFNAPLLQYLVKVYLLSPVFRFLGIDFTKSILLLARRP